MINHFLAQDLHPPPLIHRKATLQADFSARATSGSTPCVSATSWWTIWECPNGDSRLTQKNMVGKPDMVVPPYHPLVDGMFHCKPTNFG